MYILATSIRINLGLLLLFRTRKMALLYGVEVGISNNFGQSQAGHFFILVFVCVWLFPLLKMASGSHTCTAYTFNIEIISMCPLFFYKNTQNVLNGAVNILNCSAQHSTNLPYLLMFYCYQIGFLLNIYRACILTVEYLNAGIMPLMWRCKNRCLQ